jgi:GDP-4-dehydro-6-deoxy-D-mannose reductase
MRVLITGIAGFAGSHLAELLVKRGDEVSGTKLTNESTENIREIKANLNLLDCDITDLDQFTRTVEETSPDLIYHLAALSSVGESFSHPLETFDVNIRGTFYLLEILRKLKKSIRVLVVGSSDVYGKVSSRQIPISEDVPLLPKSPYGMSKAVCDLLAHRYFESHGVDVIRARAFNHTGPRQRKGFVIPDFASQIAQIEKGSLDQPMRVGDLSAQRDLTDVRDTVKAYLSLMLKGKAGESYNICSQRAYTMEDMLNILLKLSRKDIEPEVDRALHRPAEIPVLLGDNSKLRKTTGWKPEITIEKTLQDTLDYWREKAGVA